MAVMSGWPVFDCYDAILPLDLSDQCLLVSFLIAYTAKITV